MIKKGYIKIKTAVLWVLKNLIIITVIIASIIGSCYADKGTFDNLGTFGDWFNGMLSPIINIVVAMYVYRTYRSQKEELENIKKQRCEETFFKMISLHHEIVNAINVEYFDGNDTKTFKGRNAIDHYKRRLSELLSGPGSVVVALGVKPKTKTKPKPELQLEAIKIAWNKLYYEENACFNLGHYFRNMYHIVKYIDKTTLSEDEKKFYIRILRAQLSSSEGVLLFYNTIHRSIANNDRSKFYDLIHEYDLLHNMFENSSSIFNKSHKDIWDKLSEIFKTTEE